MATARGGDQPMRLIGVEAQPIIAQQPFDVLDHLLLEAAVFRRVGAEVVHFGFETAAARSFV